MPPSVYDTHCEGPGGLSSTKIWGPLRRLYHQYFNEDGRYQPLPPRQDLSGKTVIISGCNSGIGKEAAFVFAQWGAQVIMACRDAPSYEQHPKETIREFLTRPGSNIKESQLEWWEVDFASLQSVKAFGKKWKESGRVCDILCNNAGIGGVNGRIITSDGFEFVNQINFLSHCLLTFYVLPSMKKSAAPRIVNTASVFHFGGVLDFADFDNEKHTSGATHGVKFYCDSKLRLMIWTVELQRRLTRSDDYRHVITHGVHPGFVASGIWQNPTIRKLPWILIKLLDFIIKRLAIDTKQGSQTILHAALRPDLGLPREYIGPKRISNVPQGVSASVGGQFVRRTTVNYHRRPEADDPLIRARLWQRVLEDLKTSESDDKLAGDLPGHTEAILGVEKH